MTQTDTKLDTYRHLRAFDRENFVHALSRRDIKVSCCCCL